MALLEGCKHEIELVVPVEEIDKETALVVEDIRKKAALPGFRPGKVPASLIRTKFANEVRQDVLERIIPKAFRAHADAEKLQVVGTPSVVDMHFHSGEPLKFKAQFEVAPEFELRDDYRGLTVPYREPVVTDEEIETRLRNLREQKAEYINEDPRPATATDHVLIALRSLSPLEGGELHENELALELGAADTMAAFTENITGMEPGDEKEFDVTYPEEYGSERLAGKTVKFACTLKTIRRKELPEVNDEFAQDLGDFKSLDELKDAVRRSIYAERDMTARQDAHTAILDVLVGLYDFPVPQAYVDQQIETLIESRLRSLAGQGVDPRTLNLDWNKIKESQAPRAQKDVRASLLLEKVADREAIHATQDEVDAEVQRIARQEREAVASVRRRLDQDGTLGRIAGHIRTQKTLNFLFEQASKVEPPPAETPAEEESPEPAEPQESK
ncbi:MAG: trigger factor [Acidobacteria bacterium]|nr:trigger factor [Acidobacteriota bacterium]